MNNFFSAHWSIIRKSVVSSTINKCDLPFSSFLRYNAHENECNFKLELKNLLYTHNLQFSWISIRQKTFIINFFFKILNHIKCNYLCSHFQVRLAEANRIVTLFFCFSPICAPGSSVSLGTVPSPYIRFNLMTNFPSTRSMEFHQTGWFFRY